MSGTTTGWHRAVQGRSIRHERAFCNGLIYLADFSFGNTPLNQGGRQYAVIDGKQRFEAIFDFFQGKFTLDRGFAYELDASLKLGGLSYRELKLNYPTIASRFDNYNLSVMSVITDEEGKINELFVRLNRNKPLTGSEVRNAMAGPIPALIRDLADHDFFESRVTFPRNRGQDQNVAAKLLLIEFRGRFVDVKKTPLDRFVEEGLRAEAEIDDFGRAAGRAANVLDAMSEVFIERDPLLRSQGPVPVYYWLVRELNDRRGQIREFLVRFEEERRANREMTRQPDRAGSADLELIQYDNLDRSTNDVGSLEGRYEILVRRFANFASSHVGLASGESEAVSDGMTEVEVLRYLNEADVSTDFAQEVRLVRTGQGVDILLRQRSNGAVSDSRAYESDSLERLVNNGDIVRLGNAIRITTAGKRRVEGDYW